MKSRREILSNILRDKRFSKFKKDVYEAVYDIPRGEVRSYKWIAQKLGRPKAYRAVGNALNKNRYPGIIPCHRVIRQDGSIGGYSKGVYFKKRLLKAEGLDLV
ncbi:MAG: MGMT family protein [Candidatus Omnitrophica bacterium]|nr:MGMT family protein [Candidatus Omnitrophota bacterium]MBI5143986.1 MGMT family protein [Candidatus Omnitrophota bacterium]